jgi:NADPH:quinone reductase-like Zn-dependent oxidoreductase
LERPADANRIRRQRRSDVGDKPATAEELFDCRRLDADMAWVGEGKLRPRIDRVLPLDRAAEAMSAIADRSVQGRILLHVK